MCCSRTVESEEKTVGIAVCNYINSVLHLTEQAVRQLTQLQQHSNLQCSNFSFDNSNLAQQKTIKSGHKRVGGVDHQ